jgi:siderophore synthetase component
MTTTTDPVALATTDLADVAPRLLPGFAAALPHGTDVVSRRLLAAAYREDLGGTRSGAIWSTAPDGERVTLPTGVHRARRHGFDQIELLDPVPTPAERLLAELDIDQPPGVAGGGAAGLAAELADARVNLAVAYARRAGIEERLGASGAADMAGALAGLPVDEQLLGYERLATDGHNLHPCGRTRLGWRVADLLRHDQESTGTGVGFVAVHEALHVGDDLGTELRSGYPDLPRPPDGYRLQPVHAWQLANVLPQRYADEFASGALRRVDTPELAAAPTTALRTVLLAPGTDGVPRYLKLSLDIQVTSTRRTISIASTRNGPAISALLADLVAELPDTAPPASGGPRVLLLPEVAGAAADIGPGRQRDLSAILRLGLAGRLEPGESAVPAAALSASSPLSGGTVLGELLARFPGEPLGFLATYARVLLRPVLRLAALGVGLEAHLQNSVPTFLGGRPYRIAFRDFAGLRLHLPRLRERAPGLALWPGSVTVTDDLAVLRAKVGYTALQAHLGELVRLLAADPGVPAGAAWRLVRRVLDEESVDAGDHAFLTAPMVPHKALVRMRLADDGDRYVPVHNPLHDA